MQCYFGLLHDDPIENQILHSCKTLNNSWTMQLHPKLAALLGNSKVYIPVGKDSHVECLQSTLEYLITVPCKKVLIIGHSQDHVDVISNY